MNSYDDYADGWTIEIVPDPNIRYNEGLTQPVRLTFRDPEHARTFASLALMAEGVRTRHSNISTEGVGEAAMMLGKQLVQDMTDVLEEAYLDGQRDVATSMLKLRTELDMEDEKVRATWLFIYENTPPFA